MYILKYLKFNKILKCQNELKKISSKKSVEKRNKLINNARDCVIDAISEIAKNCLYGNIPLNNCDFKSLSKYKVLLRKLTKKSSVPRRKKIIIQRGGFLQFLVPSTLSFIESLISELINRKSKHNE